MLNWPLISRFLPLLAMAELPVPEGKKQHGEFCYPVKEKPLASIAEGRREHVIKSMLVLKFSGNKLTQCQSNVLLYTKYSN